MENKLDEIVATLARIESSVNRLIDSSKAKKEYIRSYSKAYRSQPQKIADEKKRLHDRYLRTKADPAKYAHHLYMSALRARESKRMKEAKALREAANIF